MPANSEVCFVCGTPNPYYALYAGQEGDTVTSANSADVASESSGAATSQDSSAPGEIEGGFDLSALFAQPEQKVEEATSASPELASGLDLSSLFSWDDSAPAVEEAAVEEALSAEPTGAIEVAPVEPDEQDAASEAVESPIAQPQLDAVSAIAPSFDIETAEVDSPQIEVEQEPTTLDATTGPESEEIEAKVEPDTEARVEASTGTEDVITDQLQTVGFSEQAEVIDVPETEEPTQLANSVDADVEERELDSASVTAEVMASTFIHPEEPQVEALETASQAEELVASTLDEETSVAGEIEAPTALEAQEADAGDMLIAEETDAGMVPVEEPPVGEPSVIESEAVFLEAPVSASETAEAAGTMTADDKVTEEVVADAYERVDTSDEVPYLAQDAVEAVEATPDVAAQSEAETAHELPEMGQVEEEMHLTDAPEAEPAYHTDEVERDSDLAVLTLDVAESVQELEPARVSYAEPQPEATLLTEQAGTVQQHVPADESLPALVTEHTVVAEVSATEDAPPRPASVPTASLSEPSSYEADEIDAEALEAATVSTDDLLQSYSGPEPVQPEADNDDDLVYMPDPVAADTSEGQSDQPIEDAASPDVDTLENESLAIAYASETEVAPVKAEAELTSTSQYEDVTSEYGVASQAPDLAVSVMAAVGAEASGSSSGGMDEHIAEEAPAVPVPDMITSASADAGEAPQTESPPLFSYHEAKDEDLTAQHAPDEPVATVDQAEAPVEQIEAIEVAQSMEAEEGEEITEPPLASPPPTEEVPAEGALTSVEAEAEQIDPEVEPVDTETYEPTAPSMESALHVGDQPLDSASLPPDESLPVEGAQAVPEATLQVEVASLAEVEAPNVEATSPIDDAPLAADTAPQVESEPQQPPDIAPDVAHDTFLTEITTLQPASTAAEVLQAQPPQPQHLDPQTWTPPPPPPPPTPYGVPPIRANEDMWPSYVPSASVDMDLAPVSDIDTTLVAPIAMPDVAPVDPPVQPLQPYMVEQPYFPAQEASAQPVPVDTQPQPFTEEPVADISPAALIDEQPAQPAQPTDGSFDLSALFDQMQIDTSERPIPRPVVAESEPPVELSPGPVEPPVSPVEPPLSTPPRPQTVMPITITPTSSTQPSLGNHQQADGVSPYDASAWQAFSGIAGGNSQASTPQQQQTPPQEQVSWQQFAQAGAPDPYATGVGPTDQPNAEAWQPAPGMPRPQRGTPEYDAMVRAALAQRGVSYTPPTSAPQSQPQQPQAQPSSQPQPGQPRPKPGTPEYEEMVKAALAQRGIGTAPLSSPPSQPYQSPQQQQPQAQPSWQPQPGQPRPKPGTPEYEEMVRQALAQRGISTGPLPAQPPSSQGQSTPASPFAPGQPRPKPGTPEYEEMVRQALNERRQREGR
jgi:hypothetical protein